MKSYFSHDEGARNDPKLVKVLMRLGQAGKGVYWDLIEMLYEQGGYLPVADLDSLAFGLRCEVGLLTSLLADFALFSQDTERFWSESVLARLRLRADKSERRAAAGAKGGRARVEREAAVKGAMPEQVTSNAQAMLKQSQAIKEKERKGKPADAGSAHEPAPAVDSASPLPTEAAAQRERGARPAKPREYPADEAPTFQIAAFGAFVDKMGYAAVDKGYYLLRIQRKADKLLPRTDEGWENFILAWLDKDAGSGDLHLADAPPVDGQQTRARPVDNSRFGPAERPKTTGYSIAARLEEQKNNAYL